jgi:Zn-dependent protease with chaperone function
MSENQEQEQKKSQDLISLLKEYIATRVELTRLTVIEKSTVVISNLITDSFVLIMGILTFLFASFTLALYIGEKCESYACGFGVVALVYLALALIMYFIKDKLVDKYLNDFLVRRIFNKKK